MKTLTVFYDPQCGLCSGFRKWLEAQPKRVVVSFVDFRSPEAAERFPGLLELGADREVVVLADDGRWWQGGAAWVTCLWVTHAYRDWSYRLAAPALQPFVRKAVQLISENRLSLSRLLGMKTDDALLREIDTLPAAGCTTGTCRL